MPKTRFADVQYFESKFFLSKINKLEYLASLSICNFSMQVTKAAIGLFLNSAYRFIICSGVRTWDPRSRSTQTALSK